MKESAKMFSPEAKTAPIRHPIIGALKGTFSISADWRPEDSSLDRDELRALEDGLDVTAALIEKGFSGAQS
jgi:hypothetical protein